MTVYNGSPFLREAIDSILNQTYRGFKFLIIDNASTDNSREIVKSYTDSRIELVELPQNIGQVAALNKGLNRINTPLVARMDADDISLPERFEKQVAFMDLYPNVVACGSDVAVFHNTNHKKDSVWKYPLHSADIKVKMLFECCLPHPALMIRKDLLDEYDLRYDETLGHSEDWDLFQRAGKYFELANIPEILFRYRIHDRSVTRQTFDLQHAAAEKIDDISLDWLRLKNHPLRRVHRDLGYETLNINNREPRFIDDVIEWFDALAEANRRHRNYDGEALSRFLEERLFLVLTKNAMHGTKPLRIFLKEKLYRCVPVLWSIKFMIKILFSIKEK